MLKNISIRKRMYVIVLLILVLFSGMLLSAVRIGSVAKKIGIAEAETAMLNGQKEKIRVSTHAMAVSVGEAIKDVSEMDEKIKIIREITGPIRFEEDKSGYFFVYRGTRVVSIPTKTSLHGKDLGGTKDKNGVYFVRGLMENAHSGGGFISYVFDKPGKGTQPKLGYAEMIPGSEFWIGTGVYIDSIDTLKNEISEDISSRLTKNILWTAVISGLLFLFLLLPIILGITRAISVSMKEAINGLKEIAEGDGDLTSRLQVHSKDEIGELAKWINVFIENLQGIIRELAQNATRLNSSSKGLSEISLELSSGADGTTEKSNTVAAAAAQMSSNMAIVSATGEEASANVNRVALAAEEISATVGEIAQNAEKAHTITEDAVNQAKSTSMKVETLQVAADKINQVTEVITKISEQTNLLALNATIEAARAGESGRGFAVVAHEIKELAAQTADATREIKTQIDDIQTSTAHTVEEIELITGVIHNVNDIVSTIAAAVEEQTATTREIAHNASGASKGMHQVSENVSESAEVAGSIAQDIGDVNQAATELATISSRVKESAGELSGLAGALAKVVNRFKTDAS